jgi:hypothetical protein
MKVIETIAPPALRLAALSARLKPPVSTFGDAPFGSVVTGDCTGAG